jgi:hypothetical protein
MHPAQASGEGFGVELALRSGLGRSDCPRVHSPRPWSWRLVCPLVGASSSSLSSGSPDHVRALSGRATKARIRPVIRDDRVEDATILSRFPAAFPLPAFAFWSSCARRGVGLSLRSAYRTSRPDPDGVSTFHTLKMRPGRAPSIARGRWCSSRPTTSIGLHPPQSQRRVPAPRHNHPSMRGSRLTSPQRGFKQFARPAFPSPVATGWIGGVFGFSPSFAPRDYSRRTSGRRRIIEHGSETQRYVIDLASNLAGLLDTCDLVSHSWKEKPRRAASGRDVVVTARVYFLAFSLSGPVPSFTARFATSVCFNVPDASRRAHTSGATDPPNATSEPSPLVD